MFFDKNKDTAPKPNNKPQPPLEVCEPHRILGCRTCYPVIAPEPSKDAVEVDLVKEISLAEFPKIDATTITFMVWVLYKMNMLTRIQVRDFLLLIKEGKWPADVVKYLSDEVKKI